MNKYVYIVLCCLTAALFSCNEGDFQEQALTDIELSRAIENIAGQSGRDFFKLPKEDDLGAIPQDPRNILTPEKVALGKMLYHETGLAMAPVNPASAGTYSCASCHLAAAGFQAGRQQGIGEGGIGIGEKGERRIKAEDYLESDLDVQPIRSPSTLNVAYQEQMLWNGQFGATGRNLGTEHAWKAGTPIETNHLGYEGVETQAIAGLKVHRLVIDTTFLNQAGYTPLFDRAFSEFPVSERYTSITAGLAIAAYERTLLANQSPWQQWLNGDQTAMTDIEKQGAILFLDKAGCADCHTGPALNSNKFFAYGMKDLDYCPDPVFNTTSKDPAHLGRGGFTGQAEDMYKFKVPQLYNLKDSPFLGHGSSFTSARQVVNYKNEGRPENPRVPKERLSHQFTPLHLSPREVEAISVFLENALYDPNLHRYEPDHVLSGACFPNNDPQSKADMNCN